MNTPSRAAGELIPLEDQPEPHATLIPHVYTAIARVMADMAKSGVGKLKKNAQQGFEYRGVDDVMDALAPSLAKHGLVIIPHVRARDVTERESRGGGKLFHTVLCIEYDFIAAGDGSRAHAGPIYGEAMDSGDKATNKCMAVAFKYLCTQTFCIPFSGDDPDAQTHEVAGASAATSQTEPKQPAGATAPPRPPAQQAVAPYQPHEVPTGSDGRPRVVRAGGNFGYGKKFATTPIDVMPTRDLEWFLGAERTPANIRERISIELAWRQYEASQLDAARARQRQADAAPGAGIEDEIP